MTKNDLSELLERVKAASGPDRRIDAWLAVIANPSEWNWQIRENPDQIADVGVYTPSAIPAHTASVDAALAFADRVLPDGVDMVLKQQTSGKYYHAEYDTEDGDVTAYNHPSLPLAIIAATLTAILFQEPDHDHQ